MTKKQEAVVPKRPVVVKYPKHYKRKDRVAIVGTAERSVNETPWDDDSVEKWCLGWRSDIEEGRASRFFEIHPRSFMKNRKYSDGRDYMEMLKKRNEKCPLVLLSEVPELPNATIFPKKEVNDMLCLGLPDELGEYYTKDWYMSSIAYMFTLAMYEGYKEIQVYGVDLLTSEEYQHQSPNLHYYVGLARGSGILVYIPYKAALCKSPYIYGEDHDAWSKQAIPLEQLQKRLAILEKKKTEAVSALYTIDGGIQIVNEQINYHQMIRNGIKMPNYGDGEFPEQ